MLDFLERVFRGRYDITRASGAEDALAILQSGTTFDVLVTDQKMPAMTGIELLERLADGTAGKHDGLVKVLLSGFTDVPEIQRAVERCGIHAYVVKPVDSERLQEAVKEAIDVKEGRTARRIG